MNDAIRSIRLTLIQARSRSWSSWLRLLGLYALICILVFSLNNYLHVFVSIPTVPSSSLRARVMPITTQPITTQPPSPPKPIPLPYPSTCVDVALNSSLPNSHPLCEPYQITEHRTRSSYYQRYHPEYVFEFEEHKGTTADYQPCKDLMTVRRICACLAKNEQVLTPSKIRTLPLPRRPLPLKRYTLTRRSNLVRSLP